MNWTKVEDALPDLGAKVLVYWRSIDNNPYARAIIIAERTIHQPDGSSDFDSNQWWANGRYYDTETFITHWMPLPAPPEQEGE